MGLLLIAYTALVLQDNRFCARVSNLCCVFIASLACFVPSALSAEPTGAFLCCDLAAGLLSAHVSPVTAGIREVLHGALENGGLPGWPKRLLLASGVFTVSGAPGLTQEQHSPACLPAVGLGREQRHAWQRDLRGSRAAGGLGSLLKCSPDA